MVPSRSVAVAVMVMLAGEVNTLLLAGVVIATVGGTFTVMFTAAEVVAVPRLSVALAVIWCAPAGALFQMVLYGAVVLVPSNMPLSKNSTLVIVPSLSAASAVIVMLAGAVKALLFAGAVT